MKENRKGGKERENERERKREEEREGGGKKKQTKKDRKGGRRVWKVPLYLYKVIKVHGVVKMKSVQNHSSAITPCHKSSTHTPVYSLSLSLSLSLSMYLPIQ